ncbi:BnaAnng34230D, partial [Brassica napus]
MRPSSRMGPSAHITYALGVIIMATMVAAYEPYSLPPLPSYSPSPKIEYNTPPLPYIHGSSPPPPLYYSPSPKIDYKSPPPSYVYSSPPPPYYSPSPKVDYKSPPPPYVYSSPPPPPYY